jgi:hypothetical protein
MRPIAAINGLAVKLAIVESIAHDGEYQCQLWSTHNGLIYEYQTDSSSKQPARGSIKNNNVKNNEKFGLDRDRSISVMVVNQ